MQCTLVVVPYAMGCNGDIKSFGKKITKSGKYKKEGHHKREKRNEINVDQIVFLFEICQKNKLEVGDSKVSQP